MEFRITYGVWCSLFTDKIRTLKIEKTNTQKNIYTLILVWCKKQKSQKKKITFTRTNEKISTHCHILIFFSKTAGRRFSYFLPRMPRDLCHLSIYHIKHTTSVDMPATWDLTPQRCDMAGTLLNLH